VSALRSCLVEVTTLNEIPLYLIPKVIQMQLKESGGGVFDIRVKRTHHYHFTMTIERLVKWDREDALHQQIVPVPDDPEVTEREGVPFMPEIQDLPVTGAVPEISCVTGPIGPLTPTVSRTEIREAPHG